jgi:transcriptional regulator with XRE-family HTH domain
MAGRDEIDRDEFSHLVIDLRERNGWTQDELARRAGVVTRTVVRWERGAAPTGEGRHRIAKLLGVIPAALPTTHRQTDVANRLAAGERHRGELSEQADLNSENIESLRIDVLALRDGLRELGTVLGSRLDELEFRVRALER